MMPGIRELANLDSRLLCLGAVYALRHIDATGNLETFIRVLEQTDDLETQYQCSIGLAVGTGMLDRAPAYREFKENPEKYIYFWREWWDKERGKPVEPEETGHPPGSLKPDSSAVSGMHGQNEKYGKVRDVSTRVHGMVSEKTATSRGRDITWMLWAFLASVGVVVVLVVIRRGKGE